MSDQKDLIVVTPDQVIRVDDLALSLLDNGVRQNPAFAYLRSLGSHKSQQTMYSFLNTVAKLVNQSTIAQFDWSALRRHHIHGVIALLRESNRAPATINTYLSALKGVALEAWTLRLMDTESFQHIKLIKSVKGYRLPKGRSLTSEEIRGIFTVCEQDAEPKGLRDAAIFAVLIGCGLRRSKSSRLISITLIMRSNRCESLAKATMNGLRLCHREPGED